MRVAGTKAAQHGAPADRLLALLAPRPLTATFAAQAIKVSGRGGCEG